MTFLTLLPTHDQYPQRLSDKNCKSWETACPDDFWHFLYTSDQKINLQRKKFVLIFVASFSSKIIEPFIEIEKKSMISVKMLHDYIQPSNLSSALDLSRLLMFLLFMIVHELSWITVERHCVIFSTKSYAKEFYRWQRLR